MSIEKKTDSVSALISDYDVLVAREKAFFHGERPANSLPPIFTYWVTRYLTPQLLDMFGAGSVEEFYCNEFERICPSGVIRILSLGSGEASTEIEVAKILIDRGRSVKVFGSDMSPEMNLAARANARHAGLNEVFEFLTCDINREFPDCDVDIVMANHSLHHFVELEYIFDGVKRTIGDAGAFVVNDMIGRNGHQRWPEILEIVEVMWRLMPIEKRFDLIHGVPKPSFVDFDCANGTFEGIRSQDILPLCVRSFSFERFLGFGGLVDVFTDRMYGGNFSPDSVFDTSFIDALELINARLMRIGDIKPTIMFATMRGASCHSKFWPVSASDAVRDVNVV